MPVFISHRTADDAIAQNVATRLEKIHNIRVYIDDIDQALKLAQGTAEITNLLVDRIIGCTNLLAIVSQNTTGSWWVPFEIGIARQAPRAITTMTNQADSSLPEYLLEWPRLRGDSAVDTFARIYKAQKQNLTEKILRKEGTAFGQMSSVDNFHSSLKLALGQR
jgi:hypothetical protein